MLVKRDFAFGGHGWTMSDEAAAAAAVELSCCFTEIEITEIEIAITEIAITSNRDWCLVMRDLCIANANRETAPQ
jgi:hypothetical protein